MTHRLSLLALPAVALLCGSASAAQEYPHTDLIGRTGFLCGWAIIAVTEEGGRQCHPGQDPKLQAKLAEAVGRLERHLVENKGWTAARIAAFRAEQVESAFPEGCTGDAGLFYTAMREKGLADFDALIDQTIAIPGDPQWGDCL